jgi:hypothetical protein
VHRKIEKDLSEDLGIGRSIILKWILGNRAGGEKVGFFLLRIGTGGGFL